MRILLLMMAALLPTLAEAQLQLRDGYTIKRTWSAPNDLGVPHSMGGLLFSKDGRTLYVIGQAESSQSAAYALQVTRDPATREVTALGPASRIFDGDPSIAGGLDVGFEFGPQGTLFTTYHWGNTLAQRPGGIAGSETLFPLWDLGIPQSVTGLAFSPVRVDPATGFGRLQMSVYGGSTLWEVSLAPLGGGLFQPAEAVGFADVGSSGSGAIAYVPAGAGEFSGDLLRIDWDRREVRILDIDPASGLPIDEQTGAPALGTGAPRQAQFATAASWTLWGAAFDPVTKDLFLANWDGGIDGNKLMQVGGFDDLPRTPRRIAAILARLLQSPTTSKKALKGLQDAADQLALYFAALDRRPADYVAAYAALEKTVDALEKLQKDKLAEAAFAGQAAQTLINALKDAAVKGIDAARRAGANVSAAEQGFAKGLASLQAGKLKQAAASFSAVIAQTWPLGRRIGVSFDSFSQAITGQLFPPEAGRTVDLYAVMPYYGYVFAPMHTRIYTTTDADGRFSLSLRDWCYGDSWCFDYAKWVSIEVTDWSGAELDCPAGSVRTSEPWGYFGAMQGCQTLSVEAACQTYFDDYNNTSLPGSQTWTFDANYNLLSQGTCVSACPSHASWDGAGQMCRCDAGYHADVDRCTLTVPVTVDAATCSQFESALAAATQDRFTTARLTADIDLSACTAPGARRSAPMAERFLGTLDGNGHTLDNYRADGPMLKYLARKAVVKDLRMDHVDVLGQTFLYMFYSEHVQGSASVAAFMEPLSSLYRVRVSGAVRSTADSWAFTGGLVGIMANSSQIGVRIDQSSFEGSVTADQSSAGGLIGTTDYWEHYIRNSYAKAVVTAGRGDAGGIVPNGANPIIENCFFRGSVAATGGSAGGIMGNANYYAVVKHSYAAPTSMSATSGYTGLVMGNYDLTELKDVWGVGDAPLFYYKGPWIGYYNWYPWTPDAQFDPGWAAGLHRASTLSEVYDGLIGPTWDAAIWVKDPSKQTDPELR